MIPGAGSSAPVSYCRPYHRTPLGNVASSSTKSFSQGASAGRKTGPLSNMGVTASARARLSRSAFTAHDRIGRRGPQLLDKTDAAGTRIFNQNGVRFPLLSLRDQLVAQFRKLHLGTPLREQVAAGVIPPPDLDDAVVILLTGFGCRIRAQHDELERGQRASISAQLLSLKHGTGCGARVSLVERRERSGADLAAGRFQLIAVIALGPKGFALSAAERVIGFGERGQVQQLPALRRVLACNALCRLEPGPVGTESPPQADQPHLRTLTSVCLCSRRRPLPTAHVPHVENGFK
jgi:hypothetical protein